MAKTTKTKPKKASKKQAKASKTAGYAKDGSKDQLITKEMFLGEAIQRYPQTAEVMFKHGLHCIGCQVSAYETIEQGALAHGIDIKKFLDDLNAAARKKK